MINELKEYVNNLVTLAKLETVDRISAAISSLVYGAIIVTILFFMCMVSSVVLGIYFAQLTQSYLYGFLLVMAFYLLCLIILLLLKKSIVRGLQNTFIKKAYKSKSKLIEHE